MYPYRYSQITNYGCRSQPQCQRKVEGAASRLCRASDSPGRHAHHRSTVSASQKYVNSAFETPRSSRSCVYLRDEAARLHSATEKN